jgi:hypothetical protein
MSVTTIQESDDKAGVGDRLHFLENPFRRERFLGPSTAPARRMNGLSAEVFASSSCCRTILPCGTPVFRAVVSSHSASSGVRRIEIV